MRITWNKRSRPFARALHAAALITLGGFILTGCQDGATSPDVSDDTGEEIIDFEITAEGTAAAQGAKLLGSHKLATLPLRQQAAVSFNVAQAGDNSPLDLSHFGGAVVTAATNYNVFVNCVAPQSPETCWGNGTLHPGRFLRDLNVSNYIRIVNEYLNVDALGKFPVRDMRTQITFANSRRVTLQEIFNVLSNAVTRTGASGYGAIYHIFLPQGTGMCIAPGNCYSPDDPASWTFCAFHGSTNLTGDRHVLFSVEPYQGVEGCQFPGQTPNGLMDATASTLAHEFFEIVTDPDLDGWSNALFGYEISDMCFAFGANKLLNGQSYFLQAEYSNLLHMCTTKPAGA
jgi:hypothetical protein